jgi:hypothetical protein
MQTAQPSLSILNMLVILLSIYMYLEHFLGYGDKFPITSEGRIIAAILMTAGVGLFGTFTAYIASLFVAVDKK